MTESRTVQYTIILTLVECLTVKMTIAHVFETSVTNNSLSEDYSHPEDHTRQTTDKILTLVEYLTVKMTTAHVFETSATNNSLSEDYSHLDDHTRQTTDTPGYKPFT